MNATTKELDRRWFDAHHRGVAERHRQRASLEQRAKQLDDHEIFVFAAMKWLKSLRDEFPGHFLGTDEEMFGDASAVVAVLEIRMAGRR